MNIPAAVAMPEKRRWEKDGGGCSTRSERTFMGLNQFLPTQWSRSKEGNLAESGGAEAWGLDCLCPSDGLFGTRKSHAPSNVSSRSFGRATMGRGGRRDWVGSSIYNVRRCGPARAKSLVKADSNRSLCAACVAKWSSRALLSRSSDQLSQRLRGACQGASVPPTNEMYTCWILVRRLLGWTSRNARNASSRPMDLNARE